MVKSSGVNQHDTRSRSMWMKQSLKNGVFSLGRVARDGNLMVAILNCRECHIQPEIAEAFVVADSN